MKNLNLNCGAEKQSGKAKLVKRDLFKSVWLGIVIILGITVIVSCDKDPEYSPGFGLNETAGTSRTLSNSLQIPSSIRVAEQTSSDFRGSLTNRVPSFRGNMGLEWLYF